MACAAGHVKPCWFCSSLHLDWHLPWLSRLHVASSHWSFWVLLWLSSHCLLLQNSPCLTLWKDAAVTLGTNWGMSPDFLSPINQDTTLWLFTQDERGGIQQRLRQLFYQSKEQVETLQQVALKINSNWCLSKERSAPRNHIVLLLCDLPVASKLGERLQLFSLYYTHMVLQKLAWLLSVPWSCYENNTPNKE